MDLAGRVAIVTGGGTGIGRATCMRLAKAGAKAVVINYSRSADDAESTAEEVRSLGSEAVPHQANIADEGMVKAMVASTVERYARLDVLVNNAGTTHFIPHPDLEALTDEVWNDILSVNLKGTFFCCRAAAPELKKANGAIVNIASIAAHRASGSSIAYAVSKAGVVQLTRALALALAPEVLAVDQVVLEQREDGLGDIVRRSYPFHGCRLGKRLFLGRRRIGAKTLAEPLARHEAR